MKKIGYLICILLIIFCNVDACEKYTSTDIKSRLETEFAISGYWTNGGYCHNFIVDNRQYSLCNQTDRVIGESWLLGDKANRKSYCIEGNNIYNIISDIVRYELKKVCFIRDIIDCEYCDSRYCIDKYHIFWRSKKKQLLWLSIDSLIQETNKQIDDNILVDVAIGGTFYQLNPNYVKSSIIDTINIATIHSEDGLIRKTQGIDSCGIIIEFYDEYSFKEKIDTVRVDTVSWNSYQEYVHAWDSTDGHSTVECYENKWFHSPILEYTIDTSYYLPTPLKNKLINLLTNEILGKDESN